MDELEIKILANMSYHHNGKSFFDDKCLASKSEFSEEKAIVTKIRRLLFSPMTSQKSLFKL